MTEEITIKLGATLIQTTEGSIVVRLKTGYGSPELPIHKDFLLSVGTGEPVAETKEGA